MLRTRLPVLFLALLVAAITLPFSPLLAQPALDPTEARMVEQIRAHRPAAEALLERTVNLNSGTLNLDGVRAVGKMFATEFAKLDFETRWVDGEAFDRAGHLVAQRPGRGPGEAPKVLLIGHLDTVFEPDSPFQRFERLENDLAKGPGTTDMKGGCVVMLEALAALRAVGVLDQLQVVVVLIGDEERSGKPLSLSRAALREAAAGADVALGFEDGDGDPKTAVISRRGSSSWTLKVTGVPSHSSQIFQDAIGAGAIYEAARILSAFYEQLSSKPNLTFNPGAILGGTDVDFDASSASGTAYGKNNVVAEHAVVTGDLRAISPEQYVDAKATMRKIVAAHLPQTNATLSFDDGYPPLAPTDGNRKLLELFDRASQDLGHGPVTAVDPRKAGAADVSFVADLVPQVLDGLGLMGTGGHTVEETADLNTLPMQAERAAVLLYRLSQNSH